MASTEKAADPESGKEVPPPETGKEAGPPKTAAGAPSCGNLFMADVVLRGLLFAATLTSVVVTVTSKQTELVPVPVRPGALVPVQAKFNHSPAFIYFVAALSVACLYSIITTLASISLILKPIFTTKFLFHFILLDTVVLGLVASATGTAGGVAYVGLKGNSHVGWGKVCPVYDKFCRHIGSSVAISLFASVLLLLLIFLSTFSLHTRIRRE